MKIVLTLIAVISAIAISYLCFYGVEVTATIERGDNKNRCSISSPIFVKVKNNTFSTIRDITFNLELFKGNRSQNLLVDTDNGFSVFDVVVPPFGEESGCYTDRYIKSFLNPNNIEMRNPSAKEAASSIMDNVKNFRVFEDSHKVYISNIAVSYIE
ncbi:MULTISPECIES: hypothetical protein [Shewanella]|uniref:hypothetical protein n=1 Tax=Shewanella TaxID=22 RepID=UPI001C657A23|nr:MULTISPECIES: hypothetical protein [Shewanella]MCZ4339662.1 hypothetical protein [Shewanella colwelliana]QYK02806.1 hypothetical protein K0I62_07670 [Shewanella psychrotolerans]